MIFCHKDIVATVLTVYGIETLLGIENTTFLHHQIVATVLTVYGIETQHHSIQSFACLLCVATASTIF